jgi:hypothetical protein
VGEGEGLIAPVVLERARALYQRKLNQGAVRNPCYFAMDVTRPHDLGGSRLGRRFYIIREAEGSFRAISAGHGGGRDWDGVADFANGRVLRQGSFASRWFFARGRSEVVSTPPSPSIGMRGLQSRGCFRPCCGSRIYDPLRACVAANGRL